MKANKQTGEQYTKNVAELANKYFNTTGDTPITLNTYAEGNMGIITLLSDLQHSIEATGNFAGDTSGKLKEYWRCILNDIKCILIEEDKKNRPNVNTEETVQKTIATAQGIANYVKTETEDKQGNWNQNYNIKDGYYVIHDGIEHHVYKI